MSRLSVIQLAQAWNDTIKAYHVASEAYFHAEKACEPKELVAQLKKWYEREKVKVNDLLVYVAMFGADSVVEIKAGDKGAVVPGKSEGRVAIVSVAGPAVIVVRKKKARRERR